MKQPLPTAHFHHPATLGTIPQPQATWPNQGVRVAPVALWGDPCTQLHRPARNKQNPISGALVPQSFPGSSRKLFLKSDICGQEAGSCVPSPILTPARPRVGFTLLSSQPRGQAATLPSPSLGERPERQVTCRSRDLGLLQMPPTTVAAPLLKGNVCACAHMPAGIHETVST